ncbi:unnamed protein product [Absidia cylindrospora]
MSVTETFHGYIETTQDSLLVLEACRRSLLPTVSRRLQEKERKLVRSGFVFVFDEKNSGIKRWTDGLVWSPSRILGNFLIYRELEKRIPKRKKPSMDMTGRNRHRSNSIADHHQQQQVNGSSMKQQQHKERQLVGSLSDAYNFKEDGLIKKTMSLIVDGSPLHLISYYHPDDVVARKLRTPSTVPELVNLEISPELLVKQNFRIPPMVEPDQYSQPSPYYPTAPTSGFSAAAGQLAKSIPSSRSLSLPTTDYMHQPMYSRHNSISQFHHSASYPTENNSNNNTTSHYQQQDRLNSQYAQHRGSLQLDRNNASKPLVFDPMYNITSYNTLPSPTSSPTTPLPVSMLPPTELCTNTLSPLSSSSSSSSSFDYPHLQKPVTEHHGRILNLPTLTRQDHTSITSLLSNDSPTHHPEGHYYQQQHQHHHSSIPPPPPPHDGRSSSFSDFYHGTTHAVHHHQQQQQQKHPSTSSSSSGPLYSLDDSAMQWI